MRILLLTIWVAVAACQPVAVRGDATADFSAANRLFEEGKYVDAAKAYDRIAASGQVSASLFFNQGNAWYKAQRFGLAVASYRAAAELAPRDSDVRANLAQARSRLVRPPAPPSFWERFSVALTAREWLTLAGAAVWGFSALLFVVRLNERFRDRLRPIVGAAGVVGAAVVVISFLAIAQRTQGSDAVVVLKDAPVRFGPLDESKEMFTLPDGSEVRVVQQQEKWLMVEAASHPRPGWIRRDNVRLIK